MTNHPERFIFTLGKFTCTVIQDEGGIQTADELFNDIAEEERHRVLAMSDYDPNAIVLSYNILLIDTPTHRVLIDTGNGVETGGDGRLFSHLHALNIAPESVNVVILTHAHADHYAGMLTKNGEKTFPNADYVMWADEWAFYSSAERLEFEKNRSPERYEFIQTYFLPLRDKLRLITPDNPLVIDGISLVYAPGHTKHHVGVQIESDGQVLLYTSDAFIHPIHAENPHWKLGVDFDQEQAYTSKKSIVKSITEGDMLMLGYHFPFPGLGKIEKTAEGYYRFKRHVQ